MGNEIRAMARSDHVGLTDHEKHVVFSSNQTLRRVWSRRRTWPNTWFRESHSGYYTFVNLVHSRCSLNVSNYHCFQPGFLSSLRAKT